MTLQEEKMAFEEIQRQFESSHAELKAELEAAKAEKDFKKVVALLNEERELLKKNSERMLAILS